MKKSTAPLILLLLVCLFLALTSGIEVTSEHPFYVEGSWIKAGDLNEGDVLTLFNGKKARILEITQVIENITVFNINVEGFHNYYAEGILVHNKESKVRHAQIELIPSRVFPNREVSSRPIDYATDIDSPESYDAMMAVITSGTYTLKGFKGVYHKSGAGRLFPSYRGVNQPHHLDVVIDMLKDIYPDFPKTKQGLTAKYGEDIWRGVIQEYGGEFTGWEFGEVFGPRTMNSVRPMQARMSSYLTLMQNQFRTPISREFLIESLHWAVTRKTNGGCPAVQLASSSTTEQLGRILNIVP